MACELPPEEREDFLVSQQGVDSKTIADVRTLLHFDQGPSPLDSPLFKGNELLDEASRKLQGAAKMPQAIGSYQILDEIAKGGMGTVYRALQPKLQREVAIKVPHIGLMDEKLMRRFQLEAQILGKLKHPGIAQVYEASSAEFNGSNHLFFSMELLDGVPLLAFAKKNQPSIKERIRLFLQVCDAVEHAHQHGIVHRDLKSANVLVSDDGTAKVLDFGIALVLNAEHTATTLGRPADELIGTLSHMAPEQIDGNGLEIGPAADVYSLGVLLFELLCEIPPYDLKGLTFTAASHIVLTGQIRSLRSLGVQLGQELQAILRQALELRPENRYLSAGSLAQDLRAFLDGTPLMAAPTTWKLSLRRFTRRHPAWLSGFGAVLLVLCASGISYWMHQSKKLDPFSVHVDSKGMVSVLSESKETLYRLDFGRSEQVRGANLHSRPDEFGGGQVLILSIAKDHPSPALAGQVSFYDPQNLKDGPYWSSTSLPLNPPVDGLDEHPEVEVNIGPLWVKDFFPELPGDEVAFFQQLDPYSPTCLRIIDLEGKLLFQIWHDGAISRLFFVDSIQRLFFCGLNSESNWENRGHPGKDTGYPLVLAALDIIPGHSNESSWLVESGNPPDPTLAWYRWFGPMEQLRLLYRGWSRISAPQGKWKSESLFTWNPTFSCPSKSDNYQVTISLSIGNEGNILGRWASDSYSKLEKKEELPPLEVFQLLNYSDLPLPQ